LPGDRLQHTHGLVPSPDNMPDVRR
jgi:hypothetical protein